MTGFTIDPNQVNDLSVAFGEAASILQDAFATWSGAQTSAVTGYGAEAGAQYQADAVDPLQVRQREIVDGMTVWQRELAALLGRVVAADNAAAAGLPQPPVVFGEV